MEFKRVAKRRRSINLTSLIDIIFLLVVFFLLTSKFITAEIVDLNLSTLENSGNESSSEEAIVIILSPGGKFIMSEVEYKLTKLKTKIATLISKNKGREIVLISQKGVSVQDMITAMDQIKNSGGYNIYLAEEMS